MVRLVCTVACLGLCLGGSALSETINPYPRELLATERLLEWTFADGPAGWTAAHDCHVAAEGGRLVITSTGADPYVHGPAVRIEGMVRANLRMKCSAAGSGQVFWATAEAPGFAEQRSAHFQLIHDGRWHEYAVPLEVRGTLVGLRLDPGGAPGRIEIERLALVRARYHPLEIEKVQQAAGEVRFDVRNHGPERIEFAAAGKKVAVEGSKTVTVAVPDAAARPFESVTLTVEAAGLPPVRREVCLVHPEAKADWVRLASDKTSLMVASDGSGALVTAGGRTVAAIAPLLVRDGRALAMTCARDGRAVRCRGDGATLTLEIDGDELAATVESAEAVEGPVVRALGPLEGGIFAGLEYLSRGEQSSSTADIETAEHIRFAPDPLKVTMPLMACAAAGGLTAVTWTDMGLRPVFAAPNFFDGAQDQRMALRGRKIEATILVREAGRIEDAILWAVRTRGLPPVPDEPRSRDDQVKLALAALNGPIKGEGGWGHCAEPSWKRQPFADHASTIWRLTGEAPALDRLVPGGAHVRNDAIYFVTGRAGEWLRVRSGQAKGAMAAMKEDGSYRYAGKYRQGHYEDTASGFCAQHAMTLLEYAHLTGDAEARDAGARTLDYMKRFQAPRGAQVWELSLHTPDILASAYLVWSYVRGYELTGKDEYLAEARRWALSGVPFVYLWQRYPVMPYATVPVYGATNWRAPNWMGLPVQWCGGVYAYALLLLAPYDKTLDWKHLARGILVSGEQQQAPGGPYVGCLPDSFDLAAQRRQGPFINPCGLMSLRLALEGQLDSLAVAVGGGHRVVAPFPVRVEGGKAVVRAKKGVAYQVLIDGRRIVDVRSEGVDAIAF
jgi:hypothetical protein